MPTNLAATPLLRLALLGDAVASGATGLLMATAAGTLSQVLDLPEPLLRGAGLVLLPFAGFVAWLARRTVPGRRTVHAVIAVNLLWATDCVLLLALGFATPNALGIAFVLGQALVVLAFALAQWAGMRQAAAELVSA